MFVMSMSTISDFAVLALSKLQRKAFAPGQAICILSVKEDRLSFFMVLEHKSTGKCHPLCS